jgi:hypothetical protein
VFNPLHALLSEQCDPQVLRKWFAQGAAWSDQYAGEVGGLFMLSKQDAYDINACAL